MEKAKSNKSSVWCFTLKVCEQLMTDLRWAAPRSLFQDARCRRRGQFFRSHSRAAIHRGRSRGSGLPSARPGDCMGGNWPSPPHRMHPTHGLGCRGYCWLDWGRGARNKTKRKAKRGREWVIKTYRKGAERQQRIRWITQIAKLRGINDEYTQWSQS